MRKFDPNRLEINKKKALIKSAHTIHSLSVADNAIPRDTGYLADKSAVFMSKGNNVIISYNTVYAQYVWEKNKTGIPKWSTETFLKHRTKILKEFFEDIYK